MSGLSIVNQLRDLGAGELEFRLPAAQASGRIRSEFRFCGALLDALGDRLDRMVMSTHPGLLEQFPDAFRYTELSQFVSFYNTADYQRTAKGDADLLKELPAIFRAVSRQLELVQSAILTEFGSSSEQRGFSDMINAIRTHAEEAILRCQRDPSLTAVEYLRLMRMEYRLGGLEDYWFAQHDKAPVGFAIHEYDPKRLAPGVDVLVELEAINEGLLIDIEVNQPQEGFARVVNAAEIAEDLRKPGARLFVPKYRNVPIGMYLVFTDPASFPEVVASRIREELDDSTIPSGKDGWAKMVGLSQRGRRILKDQGFAPYRVFTEAVAESALGLGIERLWSDVRVGEQANTAVSKHEAVGWRRLGVEIDHDRYPYELLMLDPFSLLASRKEEVFDWRYQAPLRTGWIDRFNSATSLYCDLNFCGLDAPGVANFERSSLDRIEVIRDQIESELDHPVVVERKFIDGCYELIVNLGAGRHLLPAVAIRQKIPGKDLWKVEEVDYYLLGNGKPLSSLADTLNSIRTLLR